MTIRSTVLIADDNQTSRELLEDMLAAEEYQLLFACNGEEVLKRVEETPPDAILLDVMMPGMDGLQVCRRLRATPHLAEVPILIVTALDDRSARLDALTAGADDFLPKPVDAAMLCARLRTITRLNRYRRLHVEQNKFESAIQLSPDGILIVRPDGAVHLANQAMTRLLRVNEIAPGSLFDLAPATEEATFRRHLNAVVADPACVRRFETTFQHDGLSAIPVEVHMGHLNLEDGPAAQVMVRDIRERKQAEAALQQRNRSLASLVQRNQELVDQVEKHAAALALRVVERTSALTELAHELGRERDRTRSILDALGEAVVVADASGAIQYANPAIEILTGYQQSEVVGEHWRLWKSEYESESLLEEVNRAVAERETWRGEIINQRKDGTHCSAMLTVAPLPDPDPDTPLGLVAVQRDITPLKEAERLKDQFVSNVSHELRTPLSVLTLLVGSLIRRYPTLPDTKRQQMIQKMQEQIRLLGELVDDVLDISRIDSDRVSMERVPLDLVALVQSEMEQQRELTHAQKQHLDLTAPACLAVEGHEGQLRQVIRNLLSNASKYTPAGGQIQADLALLSTEALLARGCPGAANLPRATWAALFVCDTGRGIEPEDQERIFERFYRGNVEGEIPGTGLGLSIAAELVRLYRGHIAVRSRPGEGSTFAVYLPVCEGENNA